MARPRRSVAATLCALGATSLLACAQEKVDANGPPPTPIPIRRLTNAEYMATVADLFPGYELPEMHFVPDAKVLGFIGLASSQTGSQLPREQYETNAFPIAQKFTAERTTRNGCYADAQHEAS